MQAKRDTNIELLRIISMFLIVILHSFRDSGVITKLDSGTVNYYWSYFIYGITQIAVNCFVLISGYYMINTKFKLKKLASLWLEVALCSVSVYIFLVLFKETTFSIVSLVTCLFPVLSGRYWFVTTYFGLYLLTPFLNKTIKELGKNVHKNLIFLLFFLFSVWILVPFSEGMNSGGGWGLAWFIVLYFQGTYLRLYYIPGGKMKK